MPNVYAKRVADSILHVVENQILLKNKEKSSESHNSINLYVESGVSIVIPEGAILHGVEQEIYFKVCKDNNFMPPLDSDRGETLLSPLVMCGPHGTQFLKPVELRLPHCASMTSDGW